MRSIHAENHLCGRFEDILVLKDVCNGCPLPGPQSNVGAKVTLKQLDPLLRVDLESLVAFKVDHCYGNPEEEFNRYPKRRMVRHAMHDEEENLDVPSVQSAQAKGWQSVFRRLSPLFAQCRLEVGGHTGKNTREDLERGVCYKRLGLRN